MKIYWELYTAFARVGVLTFGGGYAMLPMLQKETVEHHGWVSEEEIMDYYAVSQCLPGYIAINCSLFVGHRVKGKLGGICSALGMVTPSIIIILVIAAFLQNILDYPLVQKAFFGIRVVVCALILDAVIKLWKSAVKDKFALAIYVVMLALSLFTPLPKIVLILAAVATGLIKSLVRVEEEL